MSAWAVIGIAFLAYLFGMLTVSIFAMTRIARAERGWCRHKGDCSELLAGERDE